MKNGADDDGNITFRHSFWFDELIRYYYELWLPRAKKKFSLERLEKAE